VTDGQILAAVAAEDDAMVDLIGELVAAPTLLGHEETGQAVTRRALGELGTKPVDVPLEQAALERHAAAARVTGQRPPLFASTATTDARTFHLYGGTPAVCFGPHADNEHGVDERVHIPSVTETAQAIALFVADWCGLEEVA
jgi:acetylornithine deacetylase/succinyl-diaminopimelate desuccinylase-like protein